MVNYIRYIERTVAQNYGDSFHDLENTNYWELLKILSAKDDHGSAQQSNKPKTMNAYDWLANNY